MNDGPDHRTNAYVEEKARPEKARDATNGAPSPWKVLARMAPQVPNSARRLQVSCRDRVAAIGMLLGSSKQPREKKPELLSEVQALQTGTPVEVFVIVVSLAISYDAHLRDGSSHVASMQKEICPSRRTTSMGRRNSVPKIHTSTIPSLA